MPRRTDLHSICLIGSGPIVIGQAAEFDYAGSQALKVLREDGFRTIVNTGRIGQQEVQHLHVHVIAGSEPLGRMIPRKSS